MNIGDKVKGVPANPSMRRKHPTVVGRYDEQLWEFMGKRHKTEFVVLEDGETVDCHFIEPAGRRDKETVL